jgi:hypothetical protein
VTVGVTSSGSNENLILTPKGSGVIEQRNSTNAQTFRVYNTYTDASNNEYMRFGYASNIAFVLSTANGTGSIRNLRLQAGDSGGGSGAYIDLQSSGTIVFARSGVSTRWQIDTSGHFTATTDNTYDIGASGATRPKSVHAGTFLVAGQGVFPGGTARASIGSGADGLIALYNSAGTDFSRLQFGGTTSSFPALKRSSAELQVRLADDSGFAAQQSLYIRYGSGTPEGAVTAPVGAIYSRTDGGAGTSFYVKESGTGNTGWVAK